MNELESKLNKMNTALRLISGMYPGGERTFFTSYRNLKTGIIARQALSDGGEKEFPSDLHKEARWQELSIQKDFK